MPGRWKEGEKEGQKKERKEGGNTERETYWVCLFKYVYVSEHFRRCDVLCWNYNKVLMAWGHVLPHLKIKVIINKNQIHTSLPLPYGCKMSR